MSGAFQFIGGAPDPIVKKLTTTSPTIIAGHSDYRSSVVWFQCSEIAGNTPTLTVEIYDGSTSFYLRNAKAMTAKEEVRFTEGIILNPGQFLRVTAGAANQIDVVGMATLSGALQGGG